MDPTILDYLEEYGDVPFTEKPLGDVDSLILCQLSYFKFDGLVSDVRTGGPAITVAALDAHPDREKLFADVRYEKPNRALWAGLLSGRRYRNMRLTFYINLVKKEWETQFSAITYVLEDGTVYLAFRGTDESIVGWKEDLNMGFSGPTLGQQYSARYVNMVTARLRNSFYIGGHSKGGNFAVYAAMNCAPSIRKNIRRIYCMDGPGFRPEILKQGHYDEIADRVAKFLPHSSLVGMLFEREMRYRVVESNNHGLLQHDPYSWAVEGDHFKEVSHLYEGAHFMDDTLNEWILSLSEEQVQTFVDTLYQVIGGSGADDLITLTADKKKSMEGVMAALRNVDAETAAKLRQTVGALFEITGLRMKHEVGSRMSRLMSDNT